MHIVVVHASRCCKNVFASASTRELVSARVRTDYIYYVCGCVSVCVQKARFHLLCVRAHIRVLNHIFPSAIAFASCCGCLCVR